MSNVTAFDGADGDAVSGFGHFSHPIQTMGCGAPWIIGAVEGFPSPDGLP